MLLVNCQNVHVTHRANLSVAHKVSTGRGGAGNMVRNESASRGRVSRERDGDERGRELSPTNPGGVRPVSQLTWTSGL